MTADKTTRFNAQISEEAAEWFIDFRTGDIDAAARQRFDAWIRSSPEHLAAYLEIAAIWSEGGSLDAARLLDADTLMSRLRVEANVVPLPEITPQKASQPPAPAGSRRLRQYWHAAAAIAFATLLVGAILWQQVRTTTFTTDVGEQRSLRLADGSTVELNSRSRIRVHFSERDRRVDLLEGQAFFHVARNPRPFIVHADRVRVRAVGTQFDVHRRAMETIVTVVEGRVAASQLTSAADATSEDASVFLTAGEQLTFAGQTTAEPVRANVAAATAWMRHQLVLESALLAEVAEEFNRHSPRKLIVEDAGPHPLRLSGVFSTDPEFLLRYLRERPDIVIRETESEIYITRQQP